MRTLSENSLSLLKTGDYKDRGSRTKIDIRSLYGWKPWEPIMQGSNELMKRICYAGPLKYTFCLFLSLLTPLIVTSCSDRCNGKSKPVCLATSLNIPHWPLDEPKSPTHTELTRPRPWFSPKNLHVPWVVVLSSPQSGLEEARKTRHRDRDPKLQYKHEQWDKHTT